MKNKFLIITNEITKNGYNKNKKVTTCFGFHFRLKPLIQKVNTKFSKKSFRVMEKVFKVYNLLTKIYTHAHTRFMKRKRKQGKIFDETIKNFCITMRFTGFNIIFCALYTFINLYKSVYIFFILERILLL